MACFSMLSPWLAGFGNEDPKWTFAIYILSCLNLSIAHNISKAFLDQTITPLKYVGQHAPYLLAWCQMNCIIPIWCHMCMEARSASNRCCPNALDRDIDSKVIRENEYPKYQRKVTLAQPWCCSTKKVLYYFFFPGINQGKNALGIRFRMKSAKMCKGELEKLKKWQKRLGHLQKGISLNVTKCTLN